jgi:hypothetical protein
MRTLAAAVAIALLGIISAASANQALADRVYHSSHIALHTVAGAPLKSGFVENIHPNGPQVFARERYVLIGATANTSFTVTLQVHFGSPVCAGDSVTIPSATFETNAVGNGSAQLLIPPEGIPPTAHGTTAGVLWEFSSGGQVVYETDCETVNLD